MSQRGHLRFIGSTIRCPRAEKRINLGIEHRYGQEFVCPGCGVRIDATDYFKRAKARA